MKTLSEQFIQQAIANTLEDEKCTHLHPGQSCNSKMISQFIATCRALYKMYLLVHLIPFVIFKRKKFKNRPFHELKKLLIGFIKSMLFAGGYTLIARRVMCFLAKHYKYSSINAPISAFIAGITLNFEPVSRQSQIALFCVNKSLQTLYHMARRRNYPVRVPHGECIVLGLSIAVICYHYMDCPQAIRENYLKIIDKLIGNI